MFVTMQHTKTHATTSIRLLPRSVAPLSLCSVLTSEVSVLGGICLRPVFGGGLFSAGSRAGRVRREDYVGKRLDRAFGRQELDRKHVQRGALNPAR